MVEEGGAADHGEEEASGFPAHERLEHARPGRFTVGLGQGIVSQGFVGPAGAGFGRAAEDAVEHEEREEPRAAWGESEDGHLGDHERRGEDDDAFASDNIGQRAGRDFQHDDDHGPDDIEPRVLLEGEAEVEKEDADDRVVEARVEEDAEGDEEREVAAEGGGHLATDKRGLTAG